MCPSRLLFALNQKSFSFSSISVAFLSVAFFSLGDRQVEPPSTRSRPISRFLHIPHSLIWMTLSHSQHPILVAVSFGARELARGYWKSGLARVSVLCDIRIILCSLLGFRSSLYRASALLRIKECYKRSYLSIRRVVLCFRPL